MERGDQPKSKTIVIEVHYEAEHKTHPFDSADTWGAVHSWACEKFEVAEDVCPNLELRDGTASGSALGENVAVGEEPKHRTVWLVKPGAEQYGLC